MIDNRAGEMQSLSAETIDKKLLLEKECKRKGFDEKEKDENRASPIKKRTIFAPSDAESGTPFLLQQTKLNTNKKSSEIFSPQTDNEEDNEWLKLGLELSDESAEISDFDLMSIRKEERIYETVKGNVSSIMQQPETVMPTSAQGEKNVLNKNKKQLILKYFIH